MSKSTPLRKRPSLPQGFGWPDLMLFGVIFTLAFFFLSHPDLWETANHSYVFLETLFDGKFFDFYQVCAEHANSYYYINPANYNIVIYMLFGLWELPVYLFNQLFGLALNESFLIYWAKALCAAFFVGCGYMVRLLAAELGLSRDKCALAALFFLLNPIAFYSPMAMGQYDTLCLFFTLWALVWYARGDMSRFALVLGVGIVFKFFPLMLAVPLILLTEKKLWRILRTGLLCCWLYLPTTLLFWGRTGNAATFTQAMIDRVFTTRYPMGVRETSVLVLVYLLVVFAAYVYTPQKDIQRRYMAVYLPMVVFGLLFLFIYWHPQWLVLLIPFVVLTSFAQRDQVPWFYLDIVMAAGYFLLALYEYASQTGAVLLDGGLMNHVFGLRVMAGNWHPLNELMARIPYVWVMAPVLFGGAILGNILFKLPVGDRTLADRLRPECAGRIPYKTALYGIFAAGMLGLWLVPSLYEALVSYEVILPL